MDEKMNKDAFAKELQEKDMETVTGGGDLNLSEYSPIDVKDGENNSALCPKCVSVAMDYNGTGVAEGHGGYAFTCPKCGIKVIKLFCDNNWYVRNGSAPW